MTRPCKTIALYMPSLVGGGAERVMFNLAQEFVARGIEITLVVDRLPSSYGKNLSSYQFPIIEENGQKFLELGALQLPFVLLNAKKTMFALPKLVEFLRKNSPDVLLSALPFNNFNAALATLFPAAKQTRIFLSDHAAMQMDGKSRVLKILRRCLYPLAHGVIGVSRGVTEGMQRIMPRLKNCVTIYNPILSLDYPKLYETPVDTKFLTGFPRPFIMSAGRFSAQKDFQTLLKAFALFAANNTGTLVLFGDGELRLELEALAKKLGIADKVVFAGFKNPLYPFYKLADVFVLASNFEGFGNVLVEAMATQTPVVSSDCPSGPSEILIGGKYGELVPIGDADAMAKGIIKALATPPVKRVELQKRAEDFMCGKIAEEYLKFFSQSVLR